MRWFKKKAVSDSDAIAAFWQWWSSVHKDVAAAITAGGPERFTDGFSHHVNAIHPHLQWELTPGQGSAHALVVSPAGDPALRAAAARWLAAAPAADETWQYLSERRADPSVFESTMSIEGQELELSKLRYGLTVDGEAQQIHVQCYHPGFAGLPDDLQGQITFLSLDWAIGETAVEIWVGEIGWTASEPRQPKTPEDLQNAVAAIATDDNWAIMAGEKRDGTPLLATIATPLRSARWPRFDLHVGIALPYKRYNDGQLPVDESLEALRDFEDSLGAAIGDNGILVAHETSARIRQLHFYVDSQTNARAQLEELLRLWPEGRTTAKAQHDPGFEQVGHLKR